MDKKDKPNLDEVMALAMTGMETGKIRKTTLAEFDRTYEETPDLQNQSI